MKKLSIYLFLISWLITSFQLLTASDDAKSLSLFNSYIATSTVSDAENDLEKEVLQLLDTKCNVCHRKKNPFKIFSAKNIDKHAPKIYNQVFVYQRMPKGDEIKLSEEEYELLKTWFKSKNIKNFQ